MGQIGPYGGIPSRREKLTHDVTRQLDELYRLQADAIRGSLARKIGREDAEDIVGRAFVRLAEKLEDTPVRDAPALLGSIVHGLLKNHYRDSDRLRAVELPVGLAHDVAEYAQTHGGPSHDDYSFGQNFDDVLRDLDDDDRDAFILTELRGLPVREAAEVLDESKTTVHRRAEAARTQLQKELIAA